ncbi:MAG: PDC sensor domain-containing protein [bacterium]
MESTFQQSIRKRYDYITDYLSEPMRHLANEVSAVWGEWDKMDLLMQEHLAFHPVLQRSHQMYVLDAEGVQVSSRVSRETIELEARQQSLRDRPYLAGTVPEDGLLLSQVYVDRVGGESCVTAVQWVEDDHGRKLGYLAADFKLLALPQVEQSTEDRRMWLQVKGDPSIRGTLFQQSRTHSLMDDKLDDVIDIIEELILYRGVFHAKLHFSSSRSTLWLYDDPYRYRVHVLDEILNAVCLAYPLRAYPEDAVVTQGDIPKVFQQFKALREADETVYLRAASINVINGMVALNFSCDGSHYMPVEEFLSKGEAFWFGNAGG